MERVDLIFKSILLSAGGILSFLFGGWDVLAQVLVAFVVLDVVTGYAAGFSTKNLSSEIGYRKLPKKLIIFAMVAVGHLIDTLMGTDGIIRDAVILFYCGLELLSITENAGKAGLPIPRKIKDAITVLKGDDK